MDWLTQLLSSGAFSGGLMDPARNVGSSADQILAQRGVDDVMTPPVMPAPQQPTVADVPPQPMLNPSAMVGWQGPQQGAPSPYQEAYRSEPMGLGQVLEPVPTPAPQNGVPMPRPRPSGAPAAQAPQGNDALLKTLQGVKAPAPPTPQRVGTPSLPAVRPIQGGGFAELLASLSAGPQAAAGGLKLPPTLLAALGGR